MMMPEEQDQPGEEQLWQAVFSLIPESEKIPQTQRKSFVGLIRQHLMHEQEDESAAMNIFRMDDPEPLRALAGSLKLYTYEQMLEQVQELNLTREESEMEVAHWAMRHQSAKGQFLIGEALIPFQLVRLQEHAYLLLSGEARREIVDVFSGIFGRLPGAESGKALFVDQQHHWVGWAWFTDPDQAAAEASASRLRETWKGMQ